MFLSIFVATCRPDNVVKFLDNLAETAEDLTSFEVLLKVDDDDQKSIEVIKAYQQRAKFSVKCLGTEKLDGYYSLHVGYNELLKIADPNTYFCWLLTDEIRFESKGWDSVLKKYVGFYKDDIFRIKLSIFQLKNYYDLFECLPMPDNYAVTTRKWLEITGGWGDFWGPDSWHQCVDYFLGLNKNKFYPHGIWRSFPIYDIKIGGQEAGQGIPSEEALRKRARMIHKGWAHHSTYKAQENYSRLAARLNAHIYAMKHNSNNYIILENRNKKTLSVYDANDKSLFYGEWNYKIPKLNYLLRIGQTRFSLRYSFNYLKESYSIIEKTLKNKINEMKTKFETMNLPHLIRTPTKQAIIKNNAHNTLNNNEYLTPEPNIQIYLGLIKRGMHEIERNYVTIISFFKKYIWINILFYYPYKILRLLTYLIIQIVGASCLLLKFCVDYVIFLLKKSIILTIVYILDFSLILLQILEKLTKIVVIVPFRLSTIILKRGLLYFEKDDSKNKYKLFYDGKNLKFLSDNN